jgi:hypothetical protein
MVKFYKNGIKRIIFGSFRNKISNGECVVIGVTLKCHCYHFFITPIDAKTHDLDETIKIDVEKSENQIKTPNFTIRSISSLNEAIETIKNDKNTAIYQINDKLTSLDGEIFSKLKDFLENQQVVAFQSSIDGKFFVIWKLDELHVLHVLDDIKRDDLDELCRFIVGFMVECLDQNHVGELKL